MEAVQAGQVGCRIGGGGTAPVASAHGGCVVRGRGGGLFPKIIQLAVEIVLGNNGSLLHVANGDSARWVGIRDEGGLLGGGKGLAPQDGCMIPREGDTPHAGFGSIDSIEEYGVIRDDLGYARGPVGKIPGQVLQVIKVITDMGCNAYPGLVRMCEAMLECTEETSATGYGQDHRAEFANELLPLFETCALLAPEEVKPLE